MDQRRVAIVTGGNRGLGLEACRRLAALGMDVVLTSRDSDRGSEAVRQLPDEGLQLRFYELDVSDARSVAALQRFAENELGRVDILVNNAAIMPDVRGAGEDYPSIMTADEQTIIHAFDTNAVGVVRTCRAFVPLMLRNHYGRIVNVSTQMGQLSEMGVGWPAYRLSKTALNAVTRIFAAELQGTNVLVNSLHPGWVRTEMGGSHAPRTVEEGVRTYIWLATLPDDGPTGGFFLDCSPIPW